MNTTKHITRLFLVLTILSLVLLPACGAGQTAGVNGTPVADHLVKLDKDGIGVLRGYLARGSIDTPVNGPRTTSIEVRLPAKVEGLPAGIIVPFSVPDETEISSSTVSTTTLGDYLVFHPQADLFTAFPNFPYVEITFVKQGDKFETRSIREARPPLGIFQKKAVIQRAFAPDPDGGSDGLLIGSIREALNNTDGQVSWTFAVPITIHGVIAFALVNVKSSSDTQVTNLQGPVPTNSSFSWEFVKIRFTRHGNTLTARQISVVP